MTKGKRLENLDTAKWALGVLGPDVKSSVAILILEVAVGASAALQAVLSRNVIDAAVAHDFNGVALNAVGLVLLIGSVMLVTALTRYLKEKLSSEIENRFRHRLFGTLLVGDYAAVKTLHTGDWMTRLMSDASAVANTVTNFIPSIGGAIARLIAAAVVLFVFDPILGAFVLAAGALTLIPSGAMRKTFKQQQWRVQQALSKANAFVLERLESLPVIHSFAKEEETLEEADRLLGNFRNERLNRVNTNNKFILLRGFMSKGIYALAALWCVYGIYTGTMTYGTLVAILQLVNQVQGPISNLGGIVPSLYAAIASADRLRDAETLVSKHAAFMQAADENVSDFVEIGMRDVEFSYETIERDAQERFKWAEKADADRREAGDEAAPGDQPPARTVMRNLSLRVPKGSFTAFTGPSGCGKSTALKLFLCLYPAQTGELYYENGEGAHDLADFARWLFAYVPQGNMLMSGTIRDVITFAPSAGSRDGIGDAAAEAAKGAEAGATAGAASGATAGAAAGATADAALEESRDGRADDAVWQALHIACADEFVRALDQGLDTPLSERGSGLSEGQMQRISIARAIYSNRPVLLLDESTSALDGKTEAALLSNLRNMTDKTVIIVTHRPAALEIVDTIVRFSEDGIIVG